MTINLKVPDLRELKPRITVVGVGGAGGNAVNNMITAGLEGVEFVVANTDAQALAMSRADRQIQMGVEVTEGLGAGSKPQVGAKAAEEAMPDVKAQLAGSHMAFITAGMGGGTGTGAAPVIAQAAKEEGILTVGVVTKPFQFEGTRRLTTAEEGIAELQRHVDTLIIIPNQNLFRIANETTTFADAFAMADEVLHSGVACITDLMVKEGLINLDFADVRTVMSEMGRAMMGTGEASGDRRAVEAAEAAISNPLLDDVSMRGASGLLISITGGDDMTLYEVDEAATRIREEVDTNANIIVGATFDDNLDGRIRVSVVATGIGVAVGLAGQDEADRPLEDAYKAACKPKRVEEQASETSEIVEAESEDDADEMPVPEAPAETWSGPDGITIEPARPKIIASDDDVDETVKDVVEDDEAFEPAAPVQLARQPRRMPEVEDFPVVGQNELRARESESGDHGVEAQKRKAGFLERLANVGRRMNTDEEGFDRDLEPVLDLAEEAEIVPDTQAAYGEPMSAPSIAGPAKSKAKAKASQGESAMDVMEDEDFEIPAFLRRQASL